MTDCCRCDTNFTGRVLKTGLGLYQYWYKSHIITIPMMSSVVVLERVRRVYEVSYVGTGH